MKKYMLFTTILLLALLLASCGGAPAATEVPAAEEMPSTTTEENAPPAEPAAEEEPEPTDIPEPAFEPQPPDGQRMEFEAEDGTPLVGYYYPASVPDAPIIVLMHWAGGDQTDWTKNGMVAWLQNRGGSGGQQSPAKQNAVYPAMPEGVSFAVFTFDFREFGESDGSFTPAGGLMDAEAAYAFAQTIEGVDPARMAGIGSSIGADAVVDACTDGCLGAFSLSPGGYLDVPYPAAVKMADDAEKPVTCVAAEGDHYSVAACDSATGNHYKAVIYPGSEHGDELLTEPGIPDGIGQEIFDWLALVFEIA
jgi:alpha/beta superfamily hydrolase